MNLLIKALALWIACAIVGMHYDMSSVFGESIADGDNTPKMDGAELGEESAEFRDEFGLKEMLSIVTDNTLTLNKKDMPAYWLMLQKVDQLEMAELESLCKKKVRFSDIYTSPSQYRGSPLYVELNARRVISYPIANPKLPHVDRVYEIWGWTEESKAWMYCVLTTELPKGMPSDGDIKERIDVLGYFFRMQAYQPGVSTPKGRPLVAPLVIGKVRSVSKKMQSQVDSKITDNGKLLLLPLFLMLVCWWGVRWQLTRANKRIRAGRSNVVRSERSHRRNATKSPDPLERDPSSGAYPSIASEPIRWRDLQ